MSQEVKHKALITNISAGVVEVKVVSVSACSSCRSKNFCGMSEQQDKFFKIENARQEYSFVIGEEVELRVEQKRALFAVFLTYILPALLLICSLFITANRFSETVSALISMGFVLLYFLCFLLFAKKIRCKFVVSIYPLREDMKEL